MTNATQFVAVKFRISDSRTYTYSWDGEPLHDGDTVRVEDRSGDGWKKVFVVSATDEAPSFACKPILGRHVDEPEAVAGGLPMSGEFGTPPNIQIDPLDTPLTF